MKKHITFILAITCMVAAVTLSGCNKGDENTASSMNQTEAAKINEKASEQFSGTVVETRLGKLVFDEKGMPTNETSELLFEALDFQYGVQSFLWSLPYVGAQGWLELNKANGAKGELDMVAYAGYNGSMGILTPTTNVTYIFTFPDLSKTGPVVWDIPAGAVVGSIMDFSQRAQGDFGIPGPDGGKGVKLLLVGPEQETPKDVKGYRVIQIPTTIGMFGLRIVDKAQVAEVSSKLKIYPYAERANPPKSVLIQADFNKANFYMTQPKGMAYWERLHSVIQKENVAERDRFFMEMIAKLGIEKGKPFNPSDYQRKILEQTAIVGEKIAMVNSLDHLKRSEESRYNDKTQWKYVIEPMVPRQKTEYYDALEERAAYVYEAAATSDAMVIKKEGFGSHYLGAYRDADGEWFDGSKNYHLHVAANPPAKRFWSLTLYDTETRSLIPNKTKVAEVGSLTEGIVKNEDGSFDLYFGPEAPEGKESNWVQTTPGKGWYTYFRFYGPLQTIFDKTYAMSDIEKVK